MIPADQPLVRTGALAAELNVHKSTLIAWGKTKLKAARFGRGVYLVQKLRDMGVLPRVESKAGAA